MAVYPESTDYPEILYAGELEIRPDEGLVLATGQALTLSVREFELLSAMARRQGTIVTREDLYRTVWGGELRHGDRSVDVYVSKLRSKLEAALPGPPLHPYAPGIRLPLPAAAFTKCSHGRPWGLRRLFPGCERRLFIRLPRKQF